MTDRKTPPHPAVNGDGDAPQEQAAMLRAIADNALDCLFCKDARRRYTFVNPAMARLLGRDAARILGRTPEELFDETSARLIREVDERNLAGNVINETRSLVIGGRERVFHTVQSPIRDAAGRVSGICGVVREVTETVAAQAELRQRREILARQVHEKTAELTAARDLLTRHIEDLGRARRALDTASVKTRDQISRDLHDGLGQTLVGLRYTAAALIRRLVSEGSSHVEMAREIETLAQDAIHETKRITKGVIPAELAEEGLGAALNHLAQRTSRIGRITCVCLHCETLPPLDLAVAFDLYQIVKEAVSNTLQHADADRLEIRAGPATGEQTALQIEIQDNGKGFSPSQPHGGSGLELMRHRATNIGGRLSVHSAPGQGTCVTCLFPVNAQPNDDFT